LDLYTHLRNSQESTADLRMIVGGARKNEPYI
jgi:hypothetical protein